MRAVQRCSADPVAAVRSWTRSQAQPCAGPRPSGQRQRWRHTGWPPRLPGDAHHHSISARSPRACSLGLASPRPSKNVEHMAQLTGPQGPPHSQQLQAEHGMARQADWLSGKLHQTSPARLPRSTEITEMSAAGYGPCPIFLPEGGAKAWGQPAGKGQQ